MANEMDLFNMDERQRLAWLMANRGTVIAVGVAWIGMIIWELAEGRTPLFLIAMVPVFALLRVGLFLFYCRTPSGAEGQTRGRRLGRHAKIAAAALLALALVLPLYSLGGDSVDRLSGRADAEYGYALGLVQDDWLMAFPIALAFLWPIPVLILSRRKAGRRVSIAAQLAEPLLAAASTLIALWIPQVLFDFRPIVFFFVVLSARPEVGCYLAVAANGIYVLIWLAEILRPPVAARL